MSVLLINPPFATFSGVSMSLPALSAYLKTRSIDVTVFDANTEMFHWLFSSENIDNTFDFIRRRLEELNERDELRFTEIAEFFMLGKALLKAGNRTDSFKDITDATLSLPDTHKLGLIKRAVDFVSCPFFPETIQFESQWAFSSINYLSPFDEYSTDRMIEAVDRSRLFPNFWRHVLKDKFRQQQPEIIGISVNYAGQFLAALCCARVLEDVCPEAHITLGGGFISCNLRECESPGLFDLVDSLVLDDGEIPLERLVIELGRTTPRLENVPGLVFRDNHTVRRNAIHTPLDLGSLPIPDYNALPLDRLPLSRQSSYTYVTYRLSRGCWWARCAFCRTDLPIIHDYQQPPADFHLERIKTIIRNTGIRNFFFADDMASPRVLEELSHLLIRENIKISWFVSTRFHPDLTTERGELFRKAGCQLLMLGLETYNDRLLRLLNKGTSTNLIDTVLLDLKQANLKVAVCMMVGIPTETEAEALEGFQFVHTSLDNGLIDRYTYSLFQILENSPVSCHPNDYGITHVSSRPDRDVAYPNVDFVTTGLSRQRAMELDKQFNDSLNRDLPPIEVISHQSVNRITAGNFSVTLNFDTNQINKVIAWTRSQSMPFSELMIKGEHEIKPIKCIKKQ